MHVAHKGCSADGTGGLNFGKLAGWRRNLRAPETDFLHS